MRRCCEEILRQDTRQVGSRDLQSRKMPLFRQKMTVRMVTRYTHTVTLMSKMKTTEWCCSFASSEMITLNPGKGLKQWKLSTTVGSTLKSEHTEIQQFHP